MNFLGIGPFELLLILVIATVVLGPERMAQAGRTLGRLYAQYRLRWQRDVEEMTRELRRELESLQQEVEEMRQAAESEIKTAQAALEEVVSPEISLGALEDTVNAPVEPGESEPLGAAMDARVESGDADEDIGDAQTSEESDAESIAGEPLGGVVDAQGVPDGVGGEDGIAEPGEVSPEQVEEDASGGVSDTQAVVDDAGENEVER
jgi:Tat protein translocase TatB subunit